MFDLAATEGFLMLDRSQRNRILYNCCLVVLQISCRVVQKMSMLSALRFLNFYPEISSHYVADLLGK